MPSVLDVSKPTSLRLFGFLFTAVGGLLIALGSVTTWATVEIADDPTDIFDTMIPGIDRPEGVATLVLGVIVLVAVVFLRTVGSHRARRTIALTILVAAAVAMVIGIVDLVDTRGRFVDDGGETMIATISRERDLPIDEVRRGYEQVGSDVIDIRAGVGLWVLVAGGTVGVIGGLLDLAWVGQQRLAAAGES